MNIPPALPADLTPAEKRALLGRLMQQQAAQPRSFPVSCSQQRLWFLDQLSPGNPFYNVAIAVRWKVPLLVQVLEKCLNEMVRRHEALRTTFGLANGEPVQIVAPTLTLPLPLADLRHLSPAEREPEAMRLVREEAGQPFDLTRGPLIRARLLLLGRNDSIFLLTLHHIISDGWSMGIFSRELAALYSAFAMGRPSPLPELTVQYADFAVWQRKWLQGEVLQKQLAYWKDQLAGVPVLQLPSDRPRPPVQSYRGATHTFHLSAELAASLKRLTQSEGATLFITLLTGFTALLHRYTNQDDIVVGSYIANRNRAETEGIIGFFVNTLVLRTDVSGQPTFRQLLRRVREVALGAYAHQDTPFEMLVEQLQPERDLSRNPLFQVVFQVPNAPAPTSTPPPSDAATPLLEVKPESAIFDLSVSLWETGSGLTGQMEYSCDLFEAATIERMASHLVILLNSLAATPDDPVTRPSLLTAAERLLLLNDWNNTSKPYPVDRSVIELFEEQTQRTPAAGAFLFQHQSLTYAELDRRANQLAHDLIANGAGAEVPVGVCLERSLDLVVALLAVWKAGGVYLPLDPTYPRELLAMMIEDARARLVITRSQLRSLLEVDVPALLIDDDQARIAAQSGIKPPIHLAPEQLAYIISTSGSTGQPKSIAVEHRQILNRLFWMWDACPFEPGEVGCQKTALNFVDSLWELLGPLLRGVPTVIIPDAAVKDPWTLIELLGHHRVTRLWLVPSLLRAMLKTYPDLERRLPHLKFWVSSGEPLTAELVRQFQKLLPGSALYNLYGTSEVWDVTWHEATAAAEVGDPVPIGRPISNMQAFALDSRLQPVPIGVPGELYVGGDGLARGYLNRQELTVEQFLPHPFSPRSGARLYRTGDLVRFRADGNLEHLGRIDQQVKIRGYRVEPGEVQAVLNQHPDLQAAAVAAHSNGADGPQLTAYLVPRAGRDLAQTDWRVWLERRFPPHLIPSAFIPLEEMPLLPNGKIDRRALPAPGENASLRRAPYVPPATPTEEAICQIWSELLKVKQVGADDHFFRHLGGHSLLATQLISRLRNQFQLELPLRCIFETPTVSGLAAAVDQARGAVIAGRPVTAGPALTRLARDQYRAPGNRHPSSPTGPEPAPPR